MSQGKIGGLAGSANQEAEAFLGGVEFHPSIKREAWGTSGEGPI
jgi:hypothetical protein